MNNVTLDLVKLSQLLPSWMRDDATDISLSESVDHFVHLIADDIPALEKWTDEAISKMSEEHLDLMAYELNITWYLYDATIEQKRQIVKDAKLIHRKLGTKWAIEQVLEIYFTSARVLEWFDYGGKPGHFKISTRYPELYVNNTNFIKVINSIKKYSQILDEVSLRNEIHGKAYSVVASSGTIRNVITDSFSISREIKQTSYSSIGQGGGYTHSVIR